MQELIFGARARRSRRRARVRAGIGLTAWIVSLIASGGAVTQGEEAPGVVARQGVVRLQSAFVPAESLPDPGRSPSARSGSRGPRSEPSSPVEDAIHAAASEFGVDDDYMRSLAWCESDLDPNSYSPAGYYGLFQFDEETWSEYGHGFIWDPVAQARTAARLLAAGEHDRWPNCA